MTPDEPSLSKRKPGTSRRARLTTNSRRNRGVGVQYPAGFLYLFAFLRRWTDNGTNIRQEQYIFGFFYALYTGLLLSLYAMAARQGPESTTIAVKHPPDNLWSWRIALRMGLCLSKRLHSIFILRLDTMDPPCCSFIYRHSCLPDTTASGDALCLAWLAVSIKMDCLALCSRRAPTAAPIATKSTGSHLPFGTLGYDTSCSGSSVPIIVFRILSTKGL